MVALLLLEEREDVTIRGIHKKYRLIMPDHPDGGLRSLNIAAAPISALRVFIDPLVKLFGWSRGDISLAYSFAFSGRLPVVVVWDALATVTGPGQYDWGNPGDSHRHVLLGTIKESGTFMFFTGSSSVP